MIAIMRAGRIIRLVRIFIRIKNENQEVIWSQSRHFLNYVSNQETFEVIKIGIL